MFTFLFALLQVKLWFSQIYRAAAVQTPRHARWISSEEQKFLSPVLQNMETQRNWLCFKLFSELRICVSKVNFCFVKFNFLLVLFSVIHIWRLRLFYLVMTKGFLVLNIILPHDHERRTTSFLKRGFYWNSHKVVIWCTFELKCCFLSFSLVSAGCWSGEAGHLHQICCQRWSSWYGEFYFSERNRCGASLTVTDWDVCSCRTVVWQQATSCWVSTVAVWSVYPRRGK